MKPPPPRKITGRRPVRLEVKIPTATMLKVLWTANLSLGQMQIETPAEVPVGAPARVRITFPGGDVELSATVSHCTARKQSPGYFVGVRFEPISDGDRASIEAVVATVKDVQRASDRKKKSAFDDTDIDID